MNRDKLFFFAGFEKMYQNPFPTLHYLVTPTQDMLNGDFSAATPAGSADLRVAKLVDFGAGSLHDCTELDEYCGQGNARSRDLLTGRTACW